MRLATIVYSADNFDTPVISRAKCSRLFILELEKFCLFCVLFLLFSPLSSSPFTYFSSVVTPILETVLYLSFRVPRRKLNLPTTLVWNLVSSMASPRLLLVQRHCSCRKDGLFIGWRGGSITRRSFNSNYFLLPFPFLLQRARRFAVLLISTARERTHFTRRSWGGGVYKRDTHVFFLLQFLYQPKAFLLTMKL